MTPTDLAACTATELLALYRSKQASPVEATQAVLARIERLNPALRAFCHIAGDEALARASSPATWQKAFKLGFSRSMRASTACVASTGEACRER